MESNEHDDAFEEWGRLMPSRADLEPIGDEDREKIFAGTTAVLLGRRRRRGVLAGLCLAVVCGLGFVTGVGWEQARVSRGGDDLTSPPKEELPRDEPDEFPGLAARSPTQLEELADASEPAERSRLLRVAGDRYLADGDVAGSLRCYEELLRGLTPDERREWSASESWLLIALKEDRTRRTSNDDEEIHDTHRSRHAGVHGPGRRILRRRWIQDGRKGKNVSGALSKISENMEELIATALQGNPELQMAEAKVKQAMAELNQIRLRVTQDVVVAHNERKLRRRALELKVKELEEQKALQARGFVSAGERYKLVTAVAHAQASISEVEAGLRYLTGGGGGIGANLKILAAVSNREPESPAAPAPDPQRPPVSVDHQRILDIGVKLAGESKTVGDVIDKLRGFVSDQTSILLHPAFRENYLEEPIDLRFSGPVSLGQALQALNDMNNEWVFLLRDYGILVAETDHAYGIWAPAIPSTAKIDSDVVPQRDAENPGK